MSTRWKVAIAVIVVVMLAGTGGAFAFVHAALNAGPVVNRVKPPPTTTTTLVHLPAVHVDMAPCVPVTGQGDLVCESTPQGIARCVNGALAQLPPNVAALMRASPTRLEGLRLGCGQKQYRHVTTGTVAG